MAAQSRSQAALFATLIVVHCLFARAETKITRPVVSDTACPAEIVTVTATDEHKASGVVRKPPGKGPFPAVVFLHGGLNERNVDRVKREVGSLSTNSRFLAAGYVTVEAVFRSRSDDPQSKEAFLDCMAILEHVRKMPEVDPKSIVAFGHSGGGSLALELAGETPLCAMIAGEPASIIFTGMYNANTRRRPDRDKIMADPKSYYTPQIQKITREKIRKIACAVMIVHGDQNEINKINNEIIVPELKEAGKDPLVILYPGQPHNFVFGQEGSPEAILKCFDDCQAFVKKYVQTQPRALDESLIQRVPAEATSRSRSRRAAE